MVQTFMVVRCFKCETFQVELVKKSNKWKCKVCGERQSVRQVYGKGQAPDCRRHVQKLNQMRGEKEREQVCLPSPPEQYKEEGPVISEEQGSIQPLLLESSKWAAFIAPEEHPRVDGGEDDDGEDDESDGEGGSSKASLVSGYHFTTDSFEYEQERKRLKRDKPAVGPGVSIFSSTAKYDFTSKNAPGSNSPCLRAVNLTVEREEGCSRGNQSQGKKVHEPSTTSKWSCYVNEVCGSDSSDDDLFPPPIHRGNKQMPSGEEHISSEDKSNFGIRKESSS